MSTQNAINFVTRMFDDRELFEKLTKTETGDERKAILKEEKLEFTGDEFVQAYTGMLAKSKTPAIADHITQIRIWWQMLNMDENYSHQ